MKNKIIFLVCAVFLTVACEKEQHTGKESRVSVTVYDENGKIINCVGSGGKLKNEIYKDLSFDKTLFDASGDFSLSSPHVQTLFEGE